MYYEPLVLNSALRRHRATGAKHPPANALCNPEFTVLHGDAGCVLPLYPSNHFHAAVFDPPYGLSAYPQVTIKHIIRTWAAGREFDFTGRKGVLGESWDGGVPNPALFADILRVLRPGGHAIVFAGVRTQHLTMLSLQLAGFEIRDVVAWVTLEGFPKGGNVGLGIDKLQGTNSEDHDVPLHLVSNIAGPNYADALKRERGYETVARPQKTPKSTLGRKWDGWRPSLKQGYEPIILVRKPLEGSVAQNVVQHGVGALNIEACRIPLADGERLEIIGDGRPLDSRGMGWGFKKMSRAADLGRYPGNVMGEFDVALEKYFYCPKVTPGERDRHLPPGMKNRHPCLKPVALLRQLSRLVSLRAGPFSIHSADRAAAASGLYWRGFAMSESSRITSTPRWRGTGSLVGRPPHRRTGGRRAPDIQPSFKRRGLKGMNFRPPLLIVTPQFQSATLISMRSVALFATISW